MYDEYQPGYDWEELIEKHIEKDVTGNARLPEDETGGETEPDHQEDAS